ncbi:MAG: MBL fold metallo-hydrolase [Trueperaceae bacterium]|nr:MBL fold metallo-hydrolase [Trueperaceae bacterium]
MAAPDPVQLSDRVYYLPGGVNMAIVRGEDDQAVLVDTGQDKEAGRTLRKACETLGLAPVAIVNTHAHADHYGGNNYLTRNLNLPVYAPPFEASIMRDPYFEPVYLYSGAKPLRELTSKWLLAKPSPVDHLLKVGGLELAHTPLDILDTSGHAHVHYSVVVDDVLIAADALFGPSVLEKYPLPFGQDIGRQIESATLLAGTDVRVTLPGHGDPSDDLGALIDVNVAAFKRAADTVADACDGATTDDVLRRSCDTLGIELTDLPRYHLNRCVVLGYLEYLRESGRVEVRLADNRLLWHANSAA